MDKFIVRPNLSLKEINDFLFDNPIKQKKEVTDCFDDYHIEIDSDCLGISSLTLYRGKRLIGRILDNQN